MAAKIPVDLLIFDFDGTITDSIPPAVDSIQAMIKELKLPYKTKKEINSHVGYGEVPLVSGSIGSSEPKLLKKAMSAYFKHYLKKGISKVKLYPHVREFLEYFKSKKKVIISNKKQGFIIHILKDFGLRKYFREVHGGDTAPCLKPDPCAINEIVKKYKADKKRVLFVGDMTIDVKTGKNAKVRTCAVTYGFDPEAKLKKSKPDLMVDDIMELKKLVA